MMTMITCLLAVQGALPPACVCMNGVMTVRLEEDVMKILMTTISGVSVLINTMWNVFLSMRDS